MFFQMFQVTALRWNTASLSPRPTEFKTRFIQSPSIFNLLSDKKLRLFQQGIIQRSSSPHCSPVVMIRKQKNSYRMAINYRQLNSIRVFHAEPTCNITEDLHKFSGSKYFSELDLCKAYYQIPLTDKAKALTAFPIHLGLMEFRRMPFGLSTACATYIRLMRILLAGLSNVSFYFDNIFVYSKDWSTHL